MNLLQVFKIKVPRNTEIEILGGVPSTGEIILHPQNYNADGYKGKLAIWYVGPKATNVKSFKIEMKPGSTDIFEQGGKPPSSHVRKGIGKIKLNASGVFDYNIRWYDYESKEEHLFDPKISIKPSKDIELLHDKIKWIIMTVILLAFIFLMWKYYVNA